MGKNSDCISSKEEGNMPPWKQERCFFMAEQRKGCCDLTTTLTASPNTEASVPFSPQHFSNIHQFTRINWVFPCSVQSSRRWKLC